ncbi:hypothetical protein BO221_02265 [Archangium sp. Cb G35]|uniref:hypothetical protein n=1 Tax=Archangium sp. Cb G35 TaxID=1920190 RepID=UPI000936224F|nr:hypothetical protein [Archangium sp. Cb G35]OJT26861.1 hypothetical protein BO221_02265 [Archangium sp. Cb G35]
MKKTLFLLPAVFMLLPGCIVVRDIHHGHRTKKSEMKSRPDCHPSQYWDGEKCRHKGKGKGARKHDD